MSQPIFIPQYLGGARLSAYACQQDPNILAWNAMLSPIQRTRIMPENTRLAKSCGPFNCSSRTCSRSCK